MRARLRALRDAILRRDSLESNMDDELRFHLDARTDDLVRRGLSRSDAARRARAEFGGVAIVKEDCRRSLGLRLAGDLTQDLAYALRCFRKNRASPP
jgi:hypothetical protein